MNRPEKRNVAIFAAGFVLSFLAMAWVHAATISLVAYVSNSIYQSNGVTPLADGSVVQIIGSGDQINDGFPMSGTNLISNQTLGDDVLLGTVTINSNILGVAGTFYSADYTFDDSQISYLYLRVYDTTANPPTGMVNWTYSPLAGYTSFFNVAFVDFGGGFSTTNYDSFVVIPEPGTANLFILFLMLLAGMRFSLRGRSREGRQGR